MLNSLLKSTAVLIGVATALATEMLQAESYVVQEVMSGLVTPRGLAFGPDGGLYVAEAGSGGSGVLGNGNTAFLGATSGLSRLLGGVQTRVLDGLPSVAAATGLNAGGLQDILFDGTGQTYGLFSFGSDSDCKRHWPRDLNVSAAARLTGSDRRQAARILGFGPWDCHTWDRSASKGRGRYDGSTRSMPGGPGS